MLKELQSRTHSNAVFSTSEDTGSVTPAQEVCLDIRMYMLPYYIST